MSTPAADKPASPFLVGLCAWLIPGAGYLLLGQQARGLTVGITIIALFILGILVGGIRVMDPPGWNDNGYMSQIAVRQPRVGEPNVLITRRIEPTDLDQQDNPTSALKSDESYAGPAIRIQPLTELGEKPWFVGQALAGPITLVASAMSVHEARRMEPEGPGERMQQAVPTAHARSWEIGALYTAVAGMLNLLALIDATFRAAQPEAKTAKNAAGSSESGARSEPRP